MKKTLLFFIALFYREQNDENVGGTKPTNKNALIKNYCELI